jgi:uncharacterized protein
MLTPSEQATLTALDLAQAGRFTELRERFAPNLQAMVVPEALEAAWNAELDKDGAPDSIGAPVSEPSRAGVIMVRVPVNCDHGSFTFIAAVNELGQLAGLQLAPPSAATAVIPWNSPAYADPSMFDEREVTLGTGPLAVPGTISLPHAPPSQPAVVLLAGSGSVDRDETIGRNKPLKDLAWGLASRGVAVLRFDKVTYAHANELKNAREFTLADEYLPAALAAVKLLHGEPAVDPRRVLLLGHSLGGTVAPRIAATEPSIAGLIILAGGAQPLHWSIVRQARYLASLNPDTAAASQPALETLSEQARMVDSPGLSASTPASQLPLGTPASYWLDLRGYNPTGTAAALDKPILILQGGRDYQVTVADDLARWQAALDGHPEATIRIYPQHNHLFTAGSGPSSPTEYEPAQHVDQAIIDDIAKWLTSTRNDPSNRGS